MRTELRWAVVFGLGTLLAIACTTPTATPTPIPTPTATVTPKPTPTPRSSSQPTATPTRMSTPTSTPTPTSVPTVAPTPTLTVPQYQSQQVVFEGAAFEVELAVTPEQRARGLMGREHLGDREGMLFIYEVEGFHSFWMKGMVIPLDMVWMDSDGVVAGATANVSPCSGRDEH